MSPLTQPKVDTRIADRYHDDAEAAEEHAGDVGGDAVLDDAGHRRQRQDVEVDRAGAGVDQRGDDAAEDQRARQVSLRLTDLFGGEGDGVPRVVGEQRACDIETPTAARKVMPAALAAGPSSAPTSGRKLAKEPLPEKKPMRMSSARAPTLSTVNRFCTRAPASTPRQLTQVNKCDDGDGDDLRARQREEAEVEEEIVLAEVQPDAAEELGEGDGHRGVETALDDEEDGPAVEEADQRAERLAQKDVLPAGLRHHRAQLAVGQRAEQSQRATDEPQPEVDAGRGDEPSHDRRRDEDARADHRAHDQRRGTEHSEAPLQRFRHLAI